MDAIGSTVLPPAAAGVHETPAAAAGGRFGEAMAQARVEAAAPPPAAAAPGAVNPVVRSVVGKLSSIDVQAKQLGQDAQKAALSGGEFTPGEMVMLSVRAHEFMFQAQLTANMANRTSDGLQQMFRQQS